MGYREEKEILRANLCRLENPLHLHLHLRTCSSPNLPSSSVFAGVVEDRGWKEGVTGMTVNTRVSLDEECFGSSPDCGDWDMIANYLNTSSL